MNYTYRKRCCKECPWRKDVAPGQFEREAYRRLAATAYDMAEKVFTCHKSSEEIPAICAGFLLHGAFHNLTVRLMVRNGEIDPNKVWALNEHKLYKNYREMAIANGVHPRDECLMDCR